MNMQMPSPKNNIYPVQTGYNKVNLPQKNTYISNENRTSCSSAFH